MICIGDSTTNNAIDSGYLNAIKAGNDASELVNYIKNHHRVENNFIYASANDISHEITHEIPQFNIKRIIAYNAVAKDSLSEESIKRIHSNKFALALFFSTRTAQIFIELVDKHKLAPQMKDMPVFCLSQKIASVFIEQQFSNVHYSSLPNSDSLLELIANFQFTKN